MGPVETRRQIHPTGKWPAEDVCVCVCVSEWWVGRCWEPGLWCVPDPDSSHTSCCSQSPALPPAAPQSPLLLPPQTPPLLSSPPTVSLSPPHSLLRLCPLQSLTAAVEAEERMLPRKLWMRSPGQEPFYSVLGVWCTARASCCFHNQGEGDAHSHPGYPASSCILAKMSGERESGNVDDYSLGVLGPCRFFFHSCSSDALISALPLASLLKTCEDVEIHVTYFLTLNISSLSGQTSQKQTHMSDTVRFDLWCSCLQMTLYFGHQFPTALHISKGNDVFRYNWLLTSGDIEWSETTGPWRWDVLGNRCRMGCRETP